MPNVSTTPTMANLFDQTLQIARAANIIAEDVVRMKFYGSEAAHPLERDFRKCVKACEVHPTPRGGLPGVTYPERLSQVGEWIMDIALTHQTYNWPNMDTKILLAAANLAGKMLAEEPEKFGLAVAKTSRRRVYLECAKH